jgi:hypothetical protein
VVVFGVDGGCVVCYAGVGGAQFVRHHVRGVSDYQLYG